MDCNICGELDQPCFNYVAKSTWCRPFPFSVVAVHHIMEGKEIENILQCDVDHAGNLVFEVKWKSSWLNEDSLRSMIIGNGKLIAQFESFCKDVHSRKEKNEESDQTCTNKVMVKTEPEDDFNTFEMTLYMCDICSGSFDSHQSLQKHQQSCVALITNESPENSNMKSTPKSKGFGDNISSSPRKNVSSIVEELRKSKAQERAGLDETNVVHTQQQTQSNSVNISSRIIPSSGDLQQNAIPVVVNNKMKLLNYPAATANATNEQNSSGTLIGVFECENCKMTFADQEYLARHKVRCKNHEFSTIRCQICHRGFTTKGSRNLHVKAVHLNLKEFECNICGKQFARKHILKVHLATHSTEHEFQCSVCGKTFKQKSNLNRHERIHEFKNFGYRCRFCGQAFTQNKHLKKHMNVMHPEQNTDEKNLLQQRI